MASSGPAASTIRRWLAQDALKPWQYRSWISVRDPQFRAKATRVVDLYQRVWDGEPLGPDEYVISSDEKPSIQARRRCHPTLAPGTGRAMRVEHEYDRGGALTYLAVYDVHQAVLHGRCAASTGIEPFMLAQPDRDRFSVVQRKVFSPNDFTNLDHIRQRLAAFEQRYNANARPFKWKFTTTDLDDLLARIERHEPAQTPTPS